MSIDPIINDLMYAMETGQELDVLNFHKSFPITSRARVEKVERDQVDMRVQAPGSVCLLSETETIILSRGLPEAVRARIVSFDLANGLLKLDSFTYIGSHFGERKIARVQPDEKIELEVTAEDKSFTGKLVDVSLNGVGIHVPPGLQRGAAVQLTIPLPEGKVSLPGKVLNVSEAPESQVRLAVGFTRNAQEIAVVMRYIRDRRKEILSEIEQMYEEAYQAQGKK